MEAVHSQLCKDLEEGFRYLRDCKGSEMEWALMC